VNELSVNRKGKGKLLLAVFLFSVFFLQLSFLSTSPNVKVLAQESSAASTVSSLTGEPIQLSETSDYVRLNFTMFVVEFYKGTTGYNKIYGKFGNVLVYDDSIVLEYLSKAPDTWKQRGTATGISWIKVNDYHYNITRYYTDYLGTTYNITYTVKSDSPVKITINLKSGQTDTYRIAWYPSGIVKTDWKQVGNRLVFGNETVDYGWIGFDWEDVYQGFGSVTQTSCEDVANGKKANIYFGIGTVNVGQTVTVDPSTVGTSTTTDATEYPFQRKSFYANGRFWVFYSDGTNMVYCTSTDGSTWTAATTVRVATHGFDFSVWFDGTYLHYAYAAASSIYYRRGTPNADGTITWSAAEQTVSTTSNAAYYPMVSVDSNGYVWIGYLENNYPYVIKSGNNDGTWGTGTITQLSGTASSYWRVSIVPLTAGKMLAIYAQSGATVKAKVWNGSAWGSAEVPTTSKIHTGYYHSAVAQGDDVHLTFLEYDTYDILYVKYTYSTNSFGTETTLKAGATSRSVPVISIDTATNDLYVFAATKTTETPAGWTANHIYYIKYTASSGTWGSWTDWIDETTEVLTYADRLTCFYKAYGSKIGLEYMTKTASPYNVRFNFLSLNTAPTIGEFQAPSTVYANKYFFLNATINDADGIADFVNATVEINGTIVLKWDNATNTFSEYSDTNNYCTLDTANSIKANLNTTAHKLSWKIKLYWNYTEGSIFVISTNTKVYDSTGASGSGVTTSLFTFEDDLIIHTDATVSDSRVNPSQSITFTASIYYYGTTTAPEDVTGITAYVELNGAQKGSDTDVTGGLSITVNAETTVALYSYNVYCATDENSVTNQTVNVIVDGLTLTGLTSPTFSETGLVTYKVQITYSYDSTAINSGTVRMVHANGTDLTVDFTANSTGWATITLSQSNSSAGTYTLYGYSEPNYGITSKAQNQTFTFYSLTLQGRDADSVNLPRALTYKVTVSSVSWGEWTSSSSASKTLFGPSQNYTVNVWWNTHYTASTTIELTATTTSNIASKVRRLNDDSYYVLVSLNSTDLPTITYVSSTRLKLTGVTASGTVNFKIDSNNWKETGQPYSVTVGTFVHYQTSNTWTWDSTSHVLTLDCTFSSVDITVDWTAPSTGDSSGGVSPTPSGPSIPAIPPPTENVTAPTVPSLPYVPTAPPSPTPTLDLTALGIGIIVITVIVGTSWDYVKKYSSNASLWNSRNTRKKKKVKWRKRT
jgi:hypothetical protein